MSSIVCGHCKGRGTQAGYTDQRGGMVSVLEECDRCKGRGEVCATCEGKGYRFRVPHGFNPFSAGAFRTANAMYPVPCRDCSQADGPTEEVRP